VVTAVSTVEHISNNSTQNTQQNKELKLFYCGTFLVENLFWYNKFDVLQFALMKCISFALHIQANSLNHSDKTKHQPV